MAALFPAIKGSSPWTLWNTNPWERSNKIHQRNMFLLIPLPPVLSGSMHQGRRWPWGVPGRQRLKLTGWLWTRRPGVMRASVGPGVWVTVRTNGVGDLLIEACWRREVQYVAAVALSTKHLQNKQIYPTVRLLSDYSGMPSAHFPELLLLPFCMAASPIKSVWSWFHKELSNNKNKNSTKRLKMSTRLAPLHPTSD